MPKTLILFSSRSGGTAAYADAVAEGARSVRFSEVEVRRVDLTSPNESETSPESKYQTFGDADELQSYDAIIVGSPSLAAAAALTALLDGAGSLTNKVGAAFTAENSGDAPVWVIMKAMAGRDMILVPPAADADVAAARQLGTRVAEVTSWITHAKSHHHAH